MDMKKEKVSYIKKVILSCKTKEQVYSTAKWFSGLNLSNGEAFSDMITKLDLKRICEEMCVYLEKKNEIAN